jgi:carboxyl-terminal processing protease
VFEKKFSINEDLWKSFINYAEKNKVKAKEEEQVKTSRKFLEVRIKGAIAQNQWGREEFFRIWNSADPTFLKAVEVIQKGSFPKITSFK